jgi:hypothetical protein
MKNHIVAATWSSGPACRERGAFARRGVATVE